MTARAFWTVAHRWAGLTIALFLIIASLTGSVLAFRAQLQPLLAPDRYPAAPSQTSRQIDWLTLRAMAERRSGGVIDTLPLHRDDGEAATFSVTARPGKPSLGFDEIVLDPYDGHEIDRARSGNIADGRAQIIPFVYQLHMSLALGGWGTWIMGVAALIWTLDCFIGFYLTLPVAPRRWWRHWRKAWAIRVPPSSGIRLNYDLHRSAGLWLWPMLFVFAWSAVAFNLRPVYAPVMSVLTGMSTAEPFTLPAAVAPPKLDWARALATARARAGEAMARRGLTFERERALYFNRADNSYGYVIRTSRDRSDDLANSWFTIDGHSGRLLRIDLPTGENAGNTIDYWLGLLHEAAVFGLPYRIAVAAIGIAIATLSITGIAIWWRKRKARLGRRRGKGRRRTEQARHRRAGHFLG